MNECASERVSAGFGRAFIVRGFQYTKGEEEREGRCGFCFKKGTRALGHVKAKRTRIPFLGPGPGPGPFRTGIWIHRIIN